MMKRFISLLIALLTLSYPLVVYVGIQYLAPAFFSAVFLSIALAKFFTLKQKNDLSQIFILLTVVIYSLTLAVINSPVLLKLYPVIISLSVAGVFLVSLRQPENVLLKMARMAGETVTPQAQIYTHKLTMIWVGLLLMNALVALYLAFYGSLQQWAFYCGFLSYSIFIGFFLAELIYRRLYIARHKAKNLPNDNS